MSTDEPNNTRVGQRRFQLAMRLAGRPGFCGCCLVFTPEDARRVRRVFALVHQLRAAVTARRAKLALQSDAADGPP